MHKLPFAYPRKIFAQLAMIMGVRMVLSKTLLQSLRLGRNIFLPKGKILPKTPALQHLNYTGVCAYVKGPLAPLTDPI